MCAKTCKHNSVKALTHRKIINVFKIFLFMKSFINIGRVLLGDMDHIPLQRIAPGTCQIHGFMYMIKLEIWGSECMSPRNTSRASCSRQ